MRVPVPWLREHCDPELDVHGIEERLTMTGTKVEAIHSHGVDAASGFVVGRVLEAEQHPDADRLQVCRVDLGPAAPDGPASIVCGAPNVAAGQTVAVALPGAVMPDGRRLQSARLRGVVSEGMILSESELELDSSPSAGEGILVLDTLDAEFAPGTPLAEVLPISQEVLELEITPNRPDCLGVFGVARELHAATGAPLSPAPWEQDPGSAGAVAGAQVTVECPDLCPRFTARVFEGVTVAESPTWLKARLRAAGQRPINNVVDITNYAMLLTGQPLHAFDLDRVSRARLNVRRASDGERIETLDGQTRALDGEMVVIEDAEGPTSIAGIMGGVRSEVGPETTRVLLEVANWDGPNIHRTSSALGLRSEASSRFEKGLAPEQCMHAQAVASRLMIDLSGATLAPGTIDVGRPQGPARVIRLRDERVSSILGLEVPVERQAEILGRLDFATEPVAGGLDVTVPALRRNDVTREVDLIEEVARIHGLERLPATLPARRGAVGILTHAQRVRRAAEDAIAGRGLHEVVGWSFAAPELLDRLRLPEGHELRRVVTLENPLSEAQSILRPTLLGSLLDVARHNVSRNGPDLAIFESGTVHRAGPEHAEEHHALGVLMTGALTPRSWRGARGEADFFAAKALLSSLLDALHIRWQVHPDSWPFLHPGRSAAVTAGGEQGDAERLGFLGELHPLVAAEWDLERTAVFVVDLGRLASLAPEVAGFRPFPSVPALRQDLAVTLPDTVPAAEALERVRGAAGETLEDVTVFDVYTGGQVGEGRRSLALALSFQAPDRTLTDEDVAPVRERIVAALTELGGELRGQ
ncbi:MAG TPA: phenylalanine--tRNA ligase subunit beta [Solirubrobacteraceae bacterium]|nr:phenylalanine--tRNA ligase subunit beta [Solirubrobacteraceae bacterium]